MERLVRLPHTALLTEYHNVVLYGKHRAPHEVQIMARNTSVNLGPHFDSFINQQLNCGRYGSASEVIRAGLRLLEEREAKVNALRSMLSEGESSGISNYSLASLIEDLDGKNI